MCNIMLFVKQFWKVAKVVIIHVLVADMLTVFSLPVPSANSVQIPQVPVSNLFYLNRDDFDPNPPNSYDLDASESIPYTIRVTTPTPLRNSVDNLFSSFRSSFRDLLQTGQNGLLRAIGSVDRTVANVQDTLENSTFGVVLEGQKAAARIYDETPQSVNRLIQRVGTIRDPRLLNQVNEVVQTWRDNKRKLYEALNQNQQDIHNIFQNTWAEVNGHLGVQNLPRKELAWY